MSTDEKYAKLLALSVLYEKKEPLRSAQVQRITCSPGDVGAILKEIEDNHFREWVKSVSHLFKSH
ncbi:MAG: hypothetical protein LBQ60_00835 [Bacteroidales bacterium]|nr:hypothetical protein [Bacteroidales bacterium]